MHSIAKSYCKHWCKGFKFDTNQGLWVLRLPGYNVNVFNS